MCCSKRCRSFRFRHSSPVLVPMWRGRAIPGADVAGGDPGPGTDVAGWRWKLLCRKCPCEISALCRESPTCCRLPMSAAAQRRGQRARAQRSAQGCVCVLATADAGRRRLGAGVRLLAATRPFCSRTCRAACNGRRVVLCHAMLGIGDVRDGQDTGHLLGSRFDSALLCRARQAAAAEADARARAQTDEDTRRAR